MKNFLLHIFHENIFIKSKIKINSNNSNNNFNNNNHIHLYLSRPHRLAAPQFQNGKKGKNNMLYS